MFQTKELKDKLFNAIKEEQFNYSIDIDMVQVNNMLDRNFQQDWYMEEIRWWAWSFDWDLYAWYVNRNWDIIYKERIPWYYKFEDDNELYEYLIWLDKDMQEYMEDVIFSVLIEEDGWYRVQSFRTYEKARAYFEKVKTDFAKALGVEDLEEYNKYQNDWWEDFYKYRDDEDNNIVLSIYVSQCM